MNKPKRYIWVVAGLNDNSANFEGVTLMVSEPCGAHSSHLKAKAELEAILNEIRQEAVDEGYEFSYEMDDNHLSVDFESGVHEYYRIYKMLVN